MRRQTNAKAWTTITRLSALAQMLAAVTVLAPVAVSGWLIAVNGMASPVPVWTVAAGAVAGALGGFILGRSISGGASSGGRRLVGEGMTVPLKSGWHLKGCEHDRVTIESQPDGTFGESVRIALPQGAHMDYIVPRGSQSSRRIEFAADLQLIYAKVRMRSRDSRTEQTGWIALTPGTDAPSPHGDGSFEWKYPVQPDAQHSGWSLYKVELADATRETFGRDGWSFLGIVAFRLRLDNTFGYLRVSA